MSGLLPAHFYWRCVKIAVINYQINEEIRDKEVRLIDEEGQQLGIVSAQVALSMAEERDLDLVKISPNAVPPVCKLMDYSKFRFDAQKKEKEAKRALKEAKKREAESNKA